MKDKHAPPFPDAEGSWELLSAASPKKSFGKFRCASSKCKNRWSSAHASSSYTQACKKCGTFTLPTVMWHNTAPRRERLGDDGTHTSAEAKPHLTDLCGACMALGKPCWHS